MDVCLLDRMGYGFNPPAENIHICPRLDARGHGLDISSIYRPRVDMKCGSLVLIRPDRLIAEDSMMPLWDSPALMDAQLMGDTVEMGHISGWMGPGDTAVIIQFEVTLQKRYTPIVKLLVSRNATVGWIDSMYLRCIK